MQHAVHRGSRAVVAVLLLFLCVVVGPVSRLAAADSLPPAPTRYFNDYAHVVSPGTAEKLNTDLENLEKESSNQILVAVFPKMQTASSIEDYCHRIFATWHVGQKGTDNGAVLFVFVQDHKMRIETNRGLEGPLPDATCIDIIDEQIAPHFKANDYDGGLAAGVASMIQATRGEYKGSGQTADERRRGDGSQDTGGLSTGAIIILLIVLFVIFHRYANGAERSLPARDPFFSGALVAGVVVLAAAEAGAFPVAVAAFRAVAGAAEAAAAPVGGGRATGSQDALTMKTSEFIQTLDNGRITTAIAAAERGSSGQIRVFVSHQQAEDALASARARFIKLGMEKTAARNAVLLYFSPRARKYAVVGDQGIHEKVGGDEFWRAVVDATMAPLLKAGSFTEAVVAGIGVIGQQLAEHYPPAAGEHWNELPDTVEEG